MKEKLLDFVKICNGPEVDIVLSQDAFAADYQEEELRLLGMAVKFAGLNGKNVCITGHNRETI